MACVVALGGHAWFYSEGGACVVLFGGVHGFIRGHAWFYSGGHAWFYSGGAYMVLFQGGMHGFIWGVCVVFSVFRIQWDTVNERAVCILLECILIHIVATWLWFFFRNNFLWQNLCWKQNLENQKPLILLVELMSVFFWQGNPKVWNLRNYYSTQNGVMASRDYFTWHKFGRNGKS